MTGQGIATDELLPEPTLLDVVTDLRRDVAELSFELDIDGAGQARDSRTRLLGQLDDHLLPRLRELSAPAVVVVAGSTGAGKSTLLNSLLGAEVSPASVIRPTTREPVLAFNPADSDLLATNALIGSVRTTEHDGVPRGLALLDAPDLDSLLVSNRDTAARMLDAADLWLFVTTAARYGDALPWRALERAKERGASVALVLNRVSAKTLGAVRADLLGRLKEHGMAGVPLFVIEDAGPHEGLLKPEAVEPVGRWLRTLAGADHARTVILRTLRGSVAALRPWAQGLLEAAEAQTDAAERLADLVSQRAPAGVAEFEAALESDRFAAGVLDARWQQIVEADPGIAKLSASRWRRVSRKTAERRDAQLGAVVDDVARVVSAQLETAVGADAVALEASLAGPDAPDGGPGLFAQVAPAQDSSRGTAILAASEGWLVQTRGTVAELLRMDETGTLVRGATRGLGENGLVGVILLATSGVASAQRLVFGLLGATGHELIAQLREDLVVRARRAVEQGRAPYAEALENRSVRDEATIGLRLRLAELKRVT